jgi:hypothetical protein
VRALDRQLRTIALLTLLIAALGSIAVLTAEKDRSPLNTAILIVAAAAAAGSMLALIFGSEPWRVVRRDVRSWWNRRPSRRWIAHHDLAQDEETEKRESGVQLILYSTNEEAVRAQGVPCIVLRLDPHTVHDSERQSLKGATVTCEVARKIGRWRGAWWDTRQAEVPIEKELQTNAVARWPDEWFDADSLSPPPGEYEVRWAVRWPNGRVERPRERFQLLEDGQPHESRLDRAYAGARSVVRHYRGQDER